MKLQKRSYEWALLHVKAEGDSDLFPTPFEIEAIEHCWPTVLANLQVLDVEKYVWNQGRRFVIPKEPLAFRTATQLDPLDSIVLAALVYEFGEAIESHRLPTDYKQVFSYRFAAQADGRLYGDNSNWETFWNVSLEKVIPPLQLPGPAADVLSNYEYVAVTDITDFYNQIYHHALENELAATKIPQQAQFTFKHFLGTLSQGVSRGIPVGPHAVHLLAECALNPVDRSLRSHARDFSRYVDDVHFFCKSKEDAEFAIYEFATILDKHQRLTLQKQKTRILSVTEFRKLASANVIDNPLNDIEEQILTVIKKHSGDLGPYVSISLKNLEDDELSMLSRDIIEPLLQLYLAPPVFLMLASTGSFADCRR